ncbi:DUF6257 family protein [Streptomyces sp. NPDC060064]|uniref:DUF6257 family protein n=1 Tax=Streptomyces sp. NPDC060064 TaxID=3347049 RepID=UPI0036A68EFD
MPYADEPKLTSWEKAKVASLMARMAKRGLADDRVNGGRVYQADLERKVERVLEGARRREAREAKTK